ncbi:MAG: PQQ-binding-like beta-propeller repeat protein [Planctomycetota bacterium]
MQNANEFIEAVEAQGLVPEALLVRLRRKLSGSTATPSAKAAAAFLVSAGALTEDQAQTILDQEVTQFSLAPDPQEPPPSSVILEAESPEVIYDAGLQEEQAKTSELETTGRVRSTRRKHLKKANANEFDSPWFLLGGGALALLLLAGGGLALLIGQGSGDESFRAAQEAYEAGSLQQAIARFEEFVEDYPSHGEYSVARVRLTMARIRQALDTAADPAMALARAEADVPRIEDEPAFGDERTDLAALLPRIALQLAERADEASQSGKGEAASQAAERSQAALAMIANTKYVPKSYREQGEIDEIRALLKRVERRSAALAALDEAIDVIRAAADDDPRAAYTAYAGFAAEHPQLADRPELLTALGEAAEAERSAARFELSPEPAESGPLETPVSRTISVIDRVAAGTAASSDLYVTQSGGFAYGLNAGDGSLAWRRPVGETLTATRPTAIDDDWLLIDARRRQLVRIDSQTGVDKWRAPLGAQAAPPVVTRERILVTTDAGELLSIDAASGDRLGVVRFAQPITTPPAVDPSTGRAYLVGDQSSVYTLDLESLSCLDVSLTGHRSQSVVAPPAIAGDLLFVFENFGYETAKMRVLRLDADRKPAEEIEPFRLAGAVTQPATVSGRKLLVATNRGEVSLFELNVEADGAPINLIARRGAVTDSMAACAVALDRGTVWIAENRLLKGAASLADSRLVAQAIKVDFKGDRFLGPIVVGDDTVLHTRRDSLTEDVIVGATNAASGEVLWQTVIAAAPLGAPTRTKPGLIAISRSGRSLVVGRQQIGAGVVDAAATRLKPSSRLPGQLQTRTDLPGGRFILTAEGAEAFASIAVAPRPRTTVRRLPGRLAARPAALGNGWLAPLSVGQVMLLDASGKQLLAPFQPPLQPGVEIAWRDPAVATVGERPLALLADDVDTVYCLGVSADKRSLELLGKHELAGRKPNGPIAILGEHGVVGVGERRLEVFSLPDLNDPVLVELEAPLVWGPYAAAPEPTAAGAESLGLMAIESGELLAFRPAEAGRIAWKASLDPGHAPVGEPLTVDSHVLIATALGRLDRRSLATGEITASVDLGQTLASGPRQLGGRIVVAATDGSLLVVPTP